MNKHENIWNIMKTTKQNETWGNTPSEHTIRNMATIGQVQESCLNLQLKQKQYISKIRCTCILCFKFL